MFWDFLIEGALSGYRDDLYVMIMFIGMILMIDITLRAARKFSIARTVAFWSFIVVLLYILCRLQYASFMVFLTANESFPTDHPVLYNFLYGFSIWMYFFQLFLLVLGTKELYKGFVSAHIFIASVVYMFVSLISDYCMPLLLVAANPAIGERGYYANFENGGGAFYLPIGLLISIVLYIIYRFFICHRIRIVLTLPRKQLQKLLYIPIIAYVTYSLIYLLINYVGIYPGQPDTIIYFILIFAVIISTHLTMFVSLFYGIISTIGYTKIEAEMIIAAEIQKESLPKGFTDLSEDGSVDLAASMKAAKSVSGDFFDYFFINSELLAVVIADVSGKGLPASLLMMKTKALIKECFLSTYDPAEIFTIVNGHLSENNNLKMFVTAFLGVLNTTTGLFTYINAGHNYPAVQNGKDVFAFLKTKNGLVLGAKKDYIYHGHDIILQKRARLFLYTDGVVEALSHREEAFGEARLIDTLNHVSAGQGQMSDMLNNINEVFYNFIGTTDQMDDITMLIMEYK